MSTPPQEIAFPSLDCAFHPYDPTNHNDGKFRALTALALQELDDVDDGFVDSLPNPPSKMPASLPGGLSPFHFGGKGCTTEPAGLDMSPEFAASPPQEDGAYVDGLPNPPSKMPASLPGGLSPFHFGGKGLTVDPTALDTSPEFAAAPGEDGSSLPSVSDTGDERQFFTNGLGFTKTLEKGSFLKGVTETKKHRSLFLNDYKGPSRTLQALPFAWQLKKGRGRRHYVSDLFLANGIVATELGFKSIWDYVRCRGWVMHTTKDVRTVQYRKLSEVFDELAPNGRATGRQTTCFDTHFKGSRLT